MNIGIVIAVIVTGLLFWGGVFVGARALMRWSRENQNRHAHPSAPIERGGYRFEFARLRHPQSDTYAADYVECSVIVPAFGDLSLADSEAREQRDLLVPSSVIGEVARIDTEDDVFDGLFGWSVPPSARAERLVADAAVRHVLAELREGFGGLWVDAGRIRVVEENRPGPQEFDVMVEFLISQLSLLPAVGGNDGGDWAQ